jgi:hypothetical protein
VNLRIGAVYRIGAWTMPEKTQPRLVPPKDFEEVVKKVLSTSKEESGNQLAKFQATNVQKRKERSSKKT